MSTSKPQSNGRISLSLKTAAVVAVLSTMALVVTESRHHGDAAVSDTPGAQSTTGSSFDYFPGHYPAPSGPSDSEQAPTF